ncbi:MAG: type I-E CRISPR-associated protein Cse1/CasA, partial [Bacteroidota bacterium]
MPYSLLDEPLFRIRLPDDTHTGATLPEVLARLATDDIASFEALQPHQQQPWYSLLVQLGALTRARTAHEDLPDTPREWHTALRALAGGDAQAWQLITDDPAQPAFMQPPIPEGSLDAASYKDDRPTPDQLDMLITSKNHDLKAFRINKPNPEHWVYALVTLQTMEGYLGVGNYGIVRMNGGLGNRPLVGLSPDLAWGPRFRRDVQVLGDARPDLLDRYDAHGHMLLWTEPWGGAKDEAIPIDNCDPYFVEICRRIRFTTGDDGSLRCWRANTKGQRLDAPDSLNGMTGDPWTPIDKGEGKALTLGEAGFT